MYIMGIDPASTTGWAILESNSDKLIEFGSIVSNKALTLEDRLELISKGLTDPLTKFKPDYISIEDLIMGISGVRTLGLLGRISGVTILTCFKITGKHCTLYNPAYWKANSIPVLKGNTKKWRTQIEVCRRFNLLSDPDLNKVDEIAKEQTQRVLTIKEQITNLRHLLSKVKNKDDKTYQNDLKNLKKTLKETEKDVDKKMGVVSKIINNLTSLNEDCADSVCIALALKTELKL